MSTLLETALGHLAWLVAHDTQNPPRRPDALVERLAVAMRDGGLEVAIDDHGDGCVSILGTRGEARALLTAHVDTVPVAPGWTRAPHALAIEGERAFGLGACDVKGGAAAMLAAALAARGPCAVLLTTDEEAGRATCMRRFVADRDPARRFDLAVVAEPTRARAVLAHRGVATGTMRFVGRAGHSSQGGASALHALTRWAGAALDLAAELDGAHASSGLRGVRFNLGRVEGGEKPNVVAARAEARFGTRPPPEIAGRALLARFAALAPDASFEEGFLGPSLAPSDPAARACDAIGLTRGDAVDFWTEAALLAEAGVPSLVLGPGDIAQAHGPDEWVRLEEIAEAARAYAAVLDADARGALEGTGATAAARSTKPTTPGGTA